MLLFKITDFVILNLLQSEFSPLRILIYLKKKKTVSIKLCSCGCFVMFVAEIAMSNNYNPSFSFGSQTACCLLRSSDKCMLKGVGSVLKHLIAKVMFEIITNLM